MTDTRSNEITTRKRKPRAARGNQKMVEVAQNTVGFFTKWADKFSFQATKTYPVKYYDINISENPPGSFEIANEDSFEMALRYIAQGLNPMVLNFASNVYPGGGWKKGARAQEEDLFRRSNYFQSLNQETVSYPLGWNVAYSPTIYIAKSREYEWLKITKPVSCLAAAAVRNPTVYIDRDGKERFVKPEEKEYMRQLIATIFHVAKTEGHNSLVLGALGCGAYHGPRHDIAELFAEAANAYRPHFKMIGFGVLVNRPADNENLRIFQETLTGGA